ncbi:hypothetical protein Fmac_008454 [Flemingia macrophylla]|uniref:60S ribosomal protein L7 n=1 Tax=Flemingia macrophylla TaxID=520843 RepID=A0ABD1MXI4_9FABA
MGEEAAKGLVPESVLKKQKRNEEWALAKKQELDAAQKRRLQTRKLIFNRAKQYAKEYDQQQKELIRLKREAKLKGGFYVDPEAKLLFIIRIRGINAMHPKTRKILQLLRLRQSRNNSPLELHFGEHLCLIGVASVLFHSGHWRPSHWRRATSSLATSDKPYLSYFLLRILRGFGKVNKQRIALTDNSIIEQTLGKHGISCIEDLIHEIMTVGPHFREANNFLWPFKLKAPLGGLKKKRNHYVEGGDAGNREDYINELIRRMN